MIAGNIMSQNAAEVAQALDSSAQSITKVYYKTPGGGIRGSIISTLYLILISLLISLHWELHLPFICMNMQSRTG